MFDSRPNRFLTVALLAAVVATLFVFGGEDEAAGIVGFIFGVYMFGEGIGWVVDNID